MQGCKCSHIRKRTLLSIALVVLGSLLLLLIMHSTLHLDRLGSHNGVLATSLLLEVAFLVLLDQVTRRAAASAENILAAVALEIVLATDLTAGHHLQDPLAAELGETEPSAAVAVDCAVSLQISIFVQSMMDSTVNKTRTPPSQAAKRQRTEAIGSRVMPVCHG